MNTLNLYPKEDLEGTQVLFTNFGDKEAEYCLSIANTLRKSGIRTELFPDSTKMKKQMAYANAKNIPFVVIAGETEMIEEKVTLKNMATSEQLLLTKAELHSLLTSQF